VERVAEFETVPWVVCWCSETVGPFSHDTATQCPSLLKDFWATIHSSRKSWLHAFVGLRLSSAMT